MKGHGRTLWQASIGSITPARLGQILRSHAEGDMNDFLTFAEEVEEKNQHYAAVLGTRKRAIEGLEFEVTAASDERADKEIAQHCQDLINKPGFIELVQDLLDALGKGFSVVNQVWTTDALNSAAPWEPVAWEWCDPRLFQLDKETGRTLRLKDPDVPEGIELEPFKYVTHFSKLKSGAPHKAALARLIAWVYLFENFTLKDWVGYVETYGQPVRLGKYGPTASDEDVATLVRALQNLGTDAAAAVPESMMIEFIKGTSQGGGDTFLKLAEFCQRCVSKAVLGQTSSTDALGSGIGSGQSDLHNDVRHDITRSDARRVCATIMRDVLKPYIDLNFGRQARYPLVTSPVLSPEDIKALSEVVDKLVTLGMAVPKKWAHLRFGIPTAREGEEVLAAPKPEVPGTPQTDPALARSRRRANAMANANGGPEAEALVADVIGGALDGWEAVNTELVEPYVDAVESAGSYEDAIRALAARYPDADPAKLAISLRAAQAAARGVGDAAD
jgi:phage gp29-like protein